MSDLGTTDRLLVIDGTNVLYRSYYALASSGLSHAGRPIWATHGLLITLSRFLRDGYSHAVIAFDSPGGCPERRSLQPAYKQTRTAPADALAYQLAWTPQLLANAGIATWALAGWEADDGLASASLRAAPAGVTVVTSDRDAYQLIDDRVRVALPDGTLLDKASVRAKTGVWPSQYPHLAALRGEPSDNLPGIPGIGAKGAAKLVDAFGSLSAILAASDSELREHIGPKAIASLREHAATSELTLRVGVLRTDLPVALDSSRLSLVNAAHVRWTLTEAGLYKASELMDAALSSVRGL